MDSLRDFLKDVLRQGYAQGNFLGLLNVVVGRQIKSSAGEVIAQGITWRALSMLLKKVRWDKEAVRELGLDPARLPPKDRERFWFLAITQGRIDSATATSAGDRLAEKLREAPERYQVGPAPRSR
jgi:hypothetical protein